MLTENAAILLAAKLEAPLQIGRHLVRAFEAGFEASVKPIDAATVEGVWSRQIDDLEPQLTRHDYDRKSLADQFDTKPAEIRQPPRGDLDPARARADRRYARQEYRFDRRIRDPAPLAEYLMSVAPNVTCVSVNVRRPIASVSNNPSAKGVLIAVLGGHHCKPLHLPRSPSDLGT